MVNVIGVSVDKAVPYVKAYEVGELLGTHDISVKGMAKFRECSFKIEASGERDKAEKLLGFKERVAGIIGNGCKPVNIYLSYESLN